MKLADGKIEFGEWLPDLPDLDNPGLTEAKGVIRMGNTYKPYLPLTTQGAALGEKVWSALRVNGVGDSGVYVGTDGKLYFSSFSSGVGAAYTDKSGAAYTAGHAWSLVQYKEQVVATNGNSLPQVHTLGAAGNFADLSATAPVAQVVGRIGQFIMLGSLPLVAGYAVQWCAIDDPSNWPTPGSATALSVQSGRQYLPAEMSSVWGIVSGDQWGLILMAGGIIRATYVGGSAVFQFDEIYRSPGPLGMFAWIKAEGLIYFASGVGFFVTDGVSVKPIGRGKVDSYFVSNWANTDRRLVAAGFDPKNRLIYWTFNNTGSSVPNEVLAFNIDEGKWTHADESVQTYVQEGETDFFIYGLQAFSASNKKIGGFTGTPGTAIITTAEAEITPGGRTFVQGFKPLISGSSSVSKTVALGTRDAQDAAVSYTSEATPNTRTNFADFRSDARFHRARVTITGTFDKAEGGEFQYVPSGVV